MIDESVLSAVDSMIVLGALALLVLLALLLPASKRLPKPVIIRFAAVAAGAVVIVLVVVAVTGTSTQQDTMPGPDAPEGTSTQQDTMPGPDAPEGTSTQQDTMPGPDAPEGTSTQQDTMPGPDAPEGTSTQQDTMPGPDAPEGTSTQQDTMPGPDAPEGTSTPVLVDSELTARIDQCVADEEERIEFTRTFSVRGEARCPGGGCLFRSGRCNRVASSARYESSGLYYLDQYRVEGTALHHGSIGDLRITERDDEGRALAVQVTLTCDPPDYPGAAGGWSRATIAGTERLRNEEEVKQNIRATCEAETLRPNNRPE